MKTCKSCGRKIRIGDEYLQIGGEKGRTYCKNCYKEKLVIYYMVDDDYIGDEFDSDIKKYYPYECKICGDKLGFDNEKAYKVNGRILCDYCAMYDLGFRYCLGDGSWEHSETKEIVSGKSRGYKEYLKKYEMEEEE